jgi:hypothetical protein
MLVVFDAVKIPPAPSSPSNSVLKDEPTVNVKFALEPFAVFEDAFVIPVVELFEITNFTFAVLTKPAPTLDKYTAVIFPEPFVTIFAIAGYPPFTIELS